MALKFFVRMKRKDKNRERNHREPIIVKIFKENDSDKRTNVRFDSDSSYSDSKSQTDTTDTNEDVTTEAAKAHKFKPNQKYYTISIYALCFVVLAALCIIAILNISLLWDVLQNILRVCAPFIGAALVSFIMTPIVNWMDGSILERTFKIKNEKLRMVLSVLISFLFVFGLITFAIVKLLPQIGDSISELVGRLPELMDSLDEFFSSIDLKVLNIDVSAISEKLDEALPSIITYVTDMAKNLLPILLNTSINIVKTLVNILLTVAISIYMVCDKRRIARAATQIVYSVTSVKRASGLINTGKECFQIFGGFIIGKSIDSIIIGILCFIATSLLGLPYPLLMSVIVGVTNMIPFFGPFIGAVPGVLLYLCIDPFSAFVFAVEILILQQFDGWVLGPMILGDSTGLRPIWVIFGITVGGAYFGVLGMFLGVPVTAVIVHLISKWLEKRLEKKKIDIS